MIAWLVRRNRLFGLFSDAHITGNRLILLLTLKVLAIPAFYYVYEQHYGGLAGYDSGKFYNDARVLNECARKHPATFAAVFAGIQDESQPQGEHAQCLAKTHNWLKGRSERFFYHDNRILIRIHALLHFIAFGSWFVHALFCCLLSFTGLFYLYRAFRHVLPGVEFIAFGSLCLFPSLWFYTGALLKEGLVVFVLGTSIWLIRCVTTGGLNTSRGMALLAFLAVSCLLKPYLLLTVQAIFTVYFLLDARPGIRLRGVVLLLAVTAIIAAGNIVSIAFKGQSVTGLLGNHQRVFRGMAEGGIFLSGDTTYLRLPYDTSLVKEVAGRKGWYTLKLGATYSYWEDSRQQDTLFNYYNVDTTSQYELEFMTPASRSNLETPDPGGRPLNAALTAIYHTLAYPFFFNAKGAGGLVASLENAVLVLAVLVIIYGVVVRRRRHLLSLTCIVVFLLICVVVGISSPNTGAITRYRAPAAVFLLLAAASHCAIEGLKMKSTRQA